MNLGNIFNSRSTNSGEAQISANEVVMQMDELRRCHSSANLRRPADPPSQSKRLQAQIDRALAAFQPFPPGKSGSPPPPDYENQPNLMSPFDSTRARPSAGA